MTVKSASEVLTVLDQYEAYDNQTQLKLAELDRFIAGVEVTAKQAGLSRQAYAHMWGNIVAVFEKSALDLKDNPLDKKPILPGGSKLPATMTPEQQLTDANPNLDPEQELSSELTAPVKAAPPVAPTAPVDWSQGRTWGKALAGGLAGALTSVLLSGSRDKEDKHYVRNALLAALAAGAATPYASNWAAGGGPGRAMDWMKGKWQGLTGSTPTPAV